MHAVSAWVEDLHRIGIAVPPFPDVSVPPVIAGGQAGSGPTPDEIERDRELQLALDAWRDAVRALHAQHVGGISTGR